MIFSGSSKLCNILFKFDLATRENRSNKFICKVVVLAVAVVVVERGCWFGVLCVRNIGDRLATKLDRDIDVTYASTQSTVDSINGMKK
jgi:hypothetical protein